MKATHKIVLCVFASYIKIVHREKTSVSNKLMSTNTEPAFQQRVRNRFVWETIEVHFKV